MSLCSHRKMKLLHCLSKAVTQFWNDPKAKNLRTWNIWHWLPEIPLCAELPAFAIFQFFLEDNFWWPSGFCKEIDKTGDCHGMPDGKWYIMYKRQEHTQVRRSKRKLLNRFYPIYHVYGIILLLFFSQTFLVNSQELLVSGFIWNKLCLSELSDSPSKQKALWRRNYIVVEDGAASVVM